MVTVPGSSMPFLRAMLMSELRKAPMSSSARSASPKSAMIESRSASRLAWSTSLRSDTEKRRSPALRPALSRAATAETMSAMAERSWDESLPMMPRSR